MSRLKLKIYEPADAESTEPEVLQPERNILPFTPAQSRTTIISGRFTSPVDRARLIRENSICPECSRCNVEPLELQDGMVSPKNRLPVPGTATIVGFHCTDCGTEWPVYELTRRNG